MTQIIQQGNADIDEALYSRQLYVMGKEAMHQLNNAHVFIAGMRGLGVEIAKNIILAGVKSVTIQDCDAVQYEDLSSQFYFTESDVGRNRAEVAHAKLAELNNYVNVIKSTTSIDISSFGKNDIDVFVMTNGIHEEQISLGRYCHEHQIKFVIANTKGLFGQIFCDFGEDFQVVDTNGESPLVQIITKISNEEKGVVNLPTDKPHRFKNNSHVAFSGVKGMTELNDREFQITVLTPYSFAIGDTRNFGTYQSGGIVTEVKKSTATQFKPFAESLREPEIVSLNSSRDYIGENLHVAFQALSRFIKKYNTKPKPWDDNDAEKFYQLATELNCGEQGNSKVTLNINYLKLFSKTCRGDLSPIEAIIGGITAQEAMKAITGKFMPIRQYLYFDAIECLPERVLSTYEYERDLPTEKSRYYSQEIIFGKDFQHRLGEAKYFVVGSGAIGCEMLKNFAMMGIGCSQEGGVFVTDMDVIEKSNLNRQFLFRSSRIGEMKSQVAAEAVKTMNPSINITAYTEPVSEETENIYNNRFFEQLDGVINALDNIKARQYIDQRCLYYKKPLIDSGTTGVKASAQVIVPFLTESYRTPPSNVPSVPMCTLRSFPTLIEHTIKWARDKFADLFTNRPLQAQEFLNDSNRFVNKLSEIQSVDEQTEIMGNVNRLLRTERPKDFVDCIAWARELFQRQFHTNINELLQRFPPDHRTETNEPFWSGIKRCPHVLQFDQSNSMHLDFIVAASNLLAYIYSIPQVRDRDRIAEKLAQIQSSVSDGSHPEKEQILTQLRSHQFDKDDDTNFHIHFIAATANLRAENYGIDAADRSVIKRVAGNIIPAIATTTAMIAGFVCLEVYKLVQGHKKLESYRNTFINLGISRFCLSEPTPPETKKVNNHEFSAWDRFELDGDVRLSELIEYFTTKYQLRPRTLVSDSVILYNEITMEQSVAQKRISELYTENTGQPIPSYIRTLKMTVYANDLNGNDVEGLPYIKLNFQ